MKFWLFILMSSLAHGQNLEVILPKQKSVLSLSEMKKKLKVQTVQIEDPVYGSKKEFDGFLLQDVLQLAGADPNAKSDELVFTSRDGYSPNISLQKLKQHVGYLVFQEHATPGRFAKVQQGKAKLSPAPFYVVWAEGASLKEEVPWPYQLVKMELVDWDQKFPLLSPNSTSSNSKEQLGFAIFKSQCVRCHSLNLQGGDVGPELNVPQNVTEYWKPEVLKAFIHKASSFRMKSKMPDFTNLSDIEVDQVIAYLGAMKNKKIKTGP